MENRIKIIRSSMGFTQKQFADMFEVDQTAVSNWETQKNKPDVSVATRISEKTKLPLDFIYGKKFIIRVPFEKWEEDEREDYEAANPLAKELLMFRYGHGVFDEDKKEKPADEGELPINTIVMNRDGKITRKTFTKAQMEMLAQMIDALPEKPKDI